MPKTDQLTNVRWRASFRAPHASGETYVMELACGHLHTRKASQNGAGVRNVTCQACQRGSKVEPELVKWWKDRLLGT